MLFSGHGLEGQVQVLVNITALGYVRICMRNKKTTYFLFLYELTVSSSLFIAALRRGHIMRLHVWITVSYLTATYYM